MQAVFNRTIAGGFTPFDPWFKSVSYIGAFSGANDNWAQGEWTSFERN